jgi:beta-galactosidase GanA
MYGIVFHLFKYFMTPYLKALRDSYEAARCLDTGITFISERQMAGGKAKAFKLLIVPSVKHIPDNMFQALDSYVQQGGAVLVTPESLLKDEYGSPAGYLEQWGIKVKSTEASGIESLGGMRQKYDQNMERVVNYDIGKAVEAETIGKSLEPFQLKTAGIFQLIDITCGEVEAADKEGRPLLVKIPRGLGNVWYLAGSPLQESLSALFDQLFSVLGVKRHLKVTDLEGNRIKGLEARLVRRKFDDLVYIANESGKMVDFKIETDRPWHTVREMRSLQYYDTASGRLEKDQVSLFLLTS